MTDDIYGMRVVAQDAATPTLTRISAEMKGMQATAGGASGSIGKLASVTGGLVTPTTAAIGAVAALSVGLVGALENAKADETSQRQLGAALEANIPTWDGNTEAIEKVIDARLRLGFTDEEQRTSLRQLVAQTKDVTAALEIQRTAMDLARLRSIDLTTASTILGKVYGGNIGILSRYGIQLAEGTTSTEALAEIQRRAQGQAEEYSAGLEGQTDALAIAFDELGEKIGYALIDPMTELVGAAADVADGLDDVFEAAGRLAFLFDEKAIPGTFLGMDLAQMAADAHNWLVEIAGSFGIPADRITAESIRGHQAAEEYGRQINQGLEGEFTKTKGVIDEAGRGIIDDTTSIFTAARLAARQEIAKIPSDFDSAFENGMPDIRDSLRDLRTMLDHELSPMQRIANLRAIKTGDEIAEALKSRDPYVRGAAHVLLESVNTELHELKSGAADAAAEGGKAFAHWLSLQKRAARIQARALANAMTGVLQEAGIIGASTAGVDTADAYISGMVAGLTDPQNIAMVQGALNRGVGEQGLGGSLPKEGPMSAAKLDAAAAAIADRYTSSLAAELGAHGRRVQGGLPSLGASPRGGGGGGATINIHFNSTLPPSPAQGQALMRQIGPEMVRWLSQNA